ncbi:MAG: SIS domain-containing protein [Acidobacteriota bacterium]
MSEKEFATYQEIVSQAGTLEKILKRLSRPPVDFNRYERVILTGCGSSLFLGQLGAFTWQTRLDVPCSAVPASELLLYPDAYLNRGESSVLFALSRTGDTSETNRAARQAQQEYGCQVIPVTCYPESKLAKLGEGAVLSEVQEESVVMTRAFTGILGAFLNWAEPEAALHQVPACISSGIRKYERPIAELAREDYRKMVFLGTGPLYPLACESMLKVKEMTGSGTEAWQTFEFRHGPKAILDDSALVWLFAARRDLPYLGDVIDEIKGLKASICLVGNRIPSELADKARYSFTVDWPFERVETEALGLLHLAQLYAFFRSVHLGKNPDHPANLSRVVKL